MCRGSAHWKKVASDQRLGTNSCKVHSFNSPVATHVAFNQRGAAFRDIYAAFKDIYAAFKDICAAFKDSCSPLAEVAFSPGSS
jgi:hypothetical protein